MTTPRIIRVDIQEQDNPDYGKSWDNGGPRQLSIRPIWSDVDLPDSFGWILRSRDRRLAERLRDALMAGAAMTDPRIATNVKGKTYVQAETHVMGRHINADLRRLGF